MKLTLVRASPLVVFAVLVGWIALDFALYGSPLSWVVGGILLCVAVIITLLGLRAYLSSWDRATCVILSITFFGERLFVAGLDILLMIGFLVLLMALASLQGITRTFAPVYQSVKDSSLIAKVDSAAINIYVRVFGLLGFTFILSFLLTLIVPFVAIQNNSLLATFIFALGLLFIITWLAISPILPLKRRV